MWQYDCVGSRRSLSLAEIFPSEFSVASPDLTTLDYFFLGTREIRCLREQPEKHCGNEGKDSTRMWQFQRYDAGKSQSVLLVLAGEVHTNWSLSIRTFIVNHSRTSFNIYDWILSHLEHRQIPLQVTAGRPPRRVVSSCAAIFVKADRTLGNILFSAWMLIRAGIAQSVWRLAMGWTTEGSGFGSR
jgi:hypothetical protein